MINYTQYLDITSLFKRLFTGLGQVNFECETEAKFLDPLNSFARRPEGNFSFCFKTQCICDVFENINFSPLEEIEESIKAVSFYGKTFGFDLYSDIDSTSIFIEKMKVLHDEVFIRLRDILEKVVRTSVNNSLNESEQPELQEIILNQQHEMTVVFQNSDIDYPEKNELLLKLETLISDALNDPHVFFQQIGYRGPTDSSICSIC